MSMDSDNNWSSSDAPAAGADGETTTEHVGFFQRLGQAIAGILIGLGLAGGVIWGTFWNEGRAIGTTRALNEGAAAVVSVPADRVDAASEGRLVHVAGDMRGGQPLVDSDFLIRAEAVRLVRRVEMYQWQEERRTETRSNAGGSQTRTTTYSYNRVWSDRPVDSGRFREADSHRNPAMPATGRALVAPDATLGAFKADERVIALFGRGAERRHDLTEQNLARFAARFGPQARIVDGAVYVGADPANPAVGDLRIAYTVLPNGPASIVAKQAGQGFAPYLAQNGRQVFLAEPGLRSAQELFADAHEANRILTWLLRAGLFLAMWLGFYLVFRPLVVLADIIPAFGSVMAAGAGLVAAALTLVVYLPTIALAWFWHRPLMSAALVAAGLAGAYGLRVLGQRRAAAADPKGQVPGPAAGQGGPSAGTRPETAFVTATAAPPAPLSYAQPAPGYPTEAPPPPAGAYPTPGQAAAASFLDVPSSLAPRGRG